MDSEFDPLADVDLDDDLDLDLADDLDDLDTDDDPLAEPEEQADPLAKVEYSGDLARDAAAELTALEQGYRDRAKAEAKRFRDATDSEFWFAVCFKTREAKEAFLEAWGLEELGDKYLDGRKVDRALRRRK